MAELPKGLTQSCCVNQNKCQPRSQKRSRQANQMTIARTESKVGSTQKPLTFSSPPYVPRAKRPSRSDYTHSENRLMEIGRENSNLVKKLTEINHRDSYSGSINSHQDFDPVPKPRPVAIAPASVNRRRSEGRIARENLILYRRLQAIKPSANMRRDNLEKQHRRNQQYKDNCSAFGRKGGGQTDSHYRGRSHLPHLSH